VALGLIAMGALALGPRAAVTLRPILGPPLAATLIAAKADHPLRSPPSTKP